MKWKCRKPHARKRALHRWHIWFAWYPVRVGKNNKVWMRNIKRKGFFARAHTFSMWLWDYKEITP